MTQITVGFCFGWNIDLTWGVGGSLAEGSLVLLWEETTDQWIKMKETGFGGEENGDNSCPLK